MDHGQGHVVIALGHVVIALGHVVIALGHVVIALGARIGGGGGGGGMTTSNPQYPPLANWGPLNICTWPYRQPTFLYTYHV